MGQEHCNCFNEKIDSNSTYHFHDSTLETNDITNTKSQYMPTSLTERNRQTTTPDDYTKAKDYFQVNKSVTLQPVLIQKLFRGAQSRENFKKIKPSLKREENEYIKNLLIRFNENLFHKVDNLNPNYNNPLAPGASTSIPKFNCKAKVTPIHGEPSLYIGEVDASGQRNGKGTLFTSKGQKYVGYWIDGQLTGKGRLTDINENYTTEGDFSGSLLNGRAKTFFSPTSYYEGDYVNGRKEGIGKEVTDEYVYTGEFYNNRKEGKGKLEYTKLQESYEGDFINDNLTGKGLYTWKNGHTYRGDFSNGIMNGEGIYCWPEGGSYKGHYVDGVKNGQGEYRWKDGKKFVGLFKNGKPEGKGKLIINGIEEIIEYKEGEIFPGK